MNVIWNICSCLIESITISYVFHMWASITCFDDYGFCWATCPEGSSQIPSLYWKVCTIIVFLFIVFLFHYRYRFSNLTLYRVSIFTINLNDEFSCLMLLLFAVTSYFCAFVIKLISLASRYNIILYRAVLFAFFFCVEWR